MDFSLVNAPFECIDDPPRELRKKFQNPNNPNQKFKSWLKFHQWLSQKDRETESPDVVFGLEESVDYLIDIMRQQGPFDGVLCFSQGGIMFRHFHRITQEIDPQSFKLNETKQTFQMPKFMISVASPVFPKMKFKYKNQEYAQRCIPQFNFPSIHLQGTKDQYNADVRIEQLFMKEANPVVVSFDEGHKFPRIISDPEFAKLKTFVLEQYNVKNGSFDGFDCDYERYNF